MHKLALTASLLALTACATPEPITDYNAPYMAGKGDLVRPTPRPERVTQRRWLACPEALWNDDCGGNDDPVSAPDSVEPDRPSVPDVERPGPDRPSEPPVSAPEPEPTPEPTPEPSPEPEPEPEPETHEPPAEPEWCE